MSDILSILTTISFVPSADDGRWIQKKTKKKNEPLFPSQKGKQRDKQKQKNQSESKTHLVHVDGLLRFSSDDDVYIVSPSSTSHRGSGFLHNFFSPISS